VDCFPEATTDKDMIDAFNALSSSVANGTVTPEGIRITRGSGTIGPNGTEAQQRFQADYTDPNTGVTYSYFKNKDKYQKMVDKKFITNDTSFFDFDGVPMSIHVPDAMFSGKISINGEQVIEGRGGLNAPAVLHDDNVFWLSTKSAAEGMARDLNAQLNLPESDGKIRMMLTSTNTKKLLSSVDGARGATKLMSLISKSLPKQYREQADKMFLDAIKEASLLTTKKENRGLKAGKILDKASTAQQAQLIVNKYLNEANQAFPDRTSVH
jgi:hypothetical protein